MIVMVAARRTAEREPDERERATAPPTMVSISESGPAWMEPRETQRMVFFSRSLSRTRIEGARPSAQPQRDVRMDHKGFAQGSHNDGPGI